MDKRKKILIITAVGLVLLVAGYIIWGKKAVSLLPGGQLPLNLPGSELNLGGTPEEKRRAGETIEVKDVAVRNFYKTGSAANKYGDWLIVDQPEYQILYFESSSSFLISILKSPFETLRRRAEGDFMARLQISEEAACKLDVTITTPHFANPKESGGSYKLSFCNQ